MAANFIGKDRMVGKIAMSIGVSTLIYYTFWIIILPILPLEEDSLIKTLFPKDALFWAIGLPTLFATLISIVLASFAYFKMWEAERERNRKEHQLN